MAIRNFAKYLAVAVLTAACQVQEPISNSQAPAKTEPVASNDIPGLVSVQFDEYLAAAIEEALAAGEAVPTKAPGMGNLIEELGIESLERVFPDAGEFEPRSRKMGMHRFYRVKFSSNVPATKASASFESMPGVVTAHPVRRIVKRAYETPNDPYFSRQWHYYNSSKAGVDINVRDVWKNYTTGNENVVVCVVDEVVDATHPDLKDNLWTDASGHTGYNFARGSWDLSVRPPQNYWDDEGDTGHGTHVAGTIAAVSNNGVGVAGIAGGDYAAGEKGVRLMSCAIFSGTKYADDTQCANAVKWGAEHGAVISQNSWGPSADLNLDGNISASELNTYRTYTIDKYHPELKVAIDYFIEYAGCDAQGNQLPDSPMKGGLVFFASGNEGAEGVDWDPYAAYEPVIGVGAFNESGNRASYSTYGEWVDIAAPAGEGYSSSGSVWSTVPTKIVTSGYAGSGWAGTSMACPHASGVAALIVSYFGGQGFTAANAKDILFGGLGNTIGGSKPVGKKLDAMASFEYGLGHQITPGENHAPAIKFSPSEITLKAHESAVISVGVSDPDGDAVEVLLEDPGSNAVTFDAATMTLRISAMKEPQGGSFTAILKATDMPSSAEFQPKSATANFSYTVLPNHAPKASGVVPDQYNASFSILHVDMAEHFTDEDGETLRYEASVSDPALASAAINGTSVVISPKEHGVITVYVTARDGIGASASSSFRVAFVNPAQPVMLSSQNVTEALQMTIDSRESVDVTVTVYNAAGAQVLRSVNTANVFNPISMDVSSLAPGRYTAVVVYSGKSVKVKFSKY